MDLFPYINALFGSDKVWSNVTNFDKTKNSFMLNRFMSIKYPIQGDLFNKLKTSGVGQANSWRLVAKKFKVVPGFIYTKTKKLDKTKKWTPDTELIELYLKYNEIGEREFKEALLYNESAVKEAFVSLAKMIKITK